ncbi:class I SAM-dependent methyltransferase [Methylomonas sp. MK1]|uniref:class I SAM-dependent methyltransferase n=1 Tax=Methylomonas sp. MK1 TaxID=1131552 RepID=UPI0003A55D80|nr:class I SAM-dependent methyltransferase [Methylomonas sp. MK1]
MAEQPNLSTPDGLESLVCHACGADSLSVFDQSRGLAAVTSDCRAWPASFLVAICPVCGLVQKVVDAAWRQSASRIYGSYDLYHQTPGRTEQVIFDQGSGLALPRSELMFGHFFRHRPLATSGTYLDLGCGTGPTLTAFSKLASGWQLFGYDPHLPDAQRVLAIPGVVEVFAGDLREISGKFDLITAVHVLEHVTEPLPFLQAMRSLMHADSRALIQIPHFPSSLFDLAIFDHCSHFTGSSISQLLAEAGLAIEAIDIELIPKEISIVVKRGEPHLTRPVGDQAESRAAVVSSIAWLCALQAQAIGVDTEHVGVFGTSIGANWLHGLLAERIEFFVDEDLSRQGQLYRGCPVLAPNAVPGRAQVLMPLPPVTAAQIRRRLGSLSADYLLPPGDTFIN